MKKRIHLKEDRYGMYYLFAEYVTAGEAEKVFEEVKVNMRHCPHLVRADRLDPESKTILYQYALPLDKRWWVEAPVEKPALAGAVRVSLLNVEEPWSEEVEVEWVEVPFDSPPCGSNCPTCIFFKQGRCAGCPLVFG